MHHRFSLLVLFDFHRPQSLDTVLGFGVVVTGMRVDLADPKSQKGERKELEYVLGRGTVCNGGQKGVFLCGSFGVGGGFDGSDSSLDWLEG